MSSWLAYIAYRMVETVARLLPASLAWRLGAALGWLCLWLSPYYRRLVTRNLTIAFGREKSPEEIRRLVRQHMIYLGGNFLASMKMPFLSAEKVLHHITVEGGEKLHALPAAGRGGVFVLMHMGNWEVLSQMSHILPGIRSGGLFQPLHNAPLNAHVLRCRERLGSRLFNRQDGFNAPVSFVRENNMLGVLSDQRAGDTGVWCPFFGRLASTTTLPVLIAKRAGAPMIPVAVVTTAPGRWKVILGEPLDGISASLTAEEAAAVMNERLEAMIRLSPADWFWVHNRWKTAKPEFLLANKKRGIALSPGFRVEDLQPFEIAVRAPDTLTDACLALPAVRAIRRGRPDARITVLTRESQAALWRMDAEVDEVVAVPDSAGVSACAAALKATGRRYDAGILFSDTKQAAQEFARGGVLHLTGYEGEGRKRLLDQVIPPRGKPGPVQHREREFLRIALRIGANIDDPTLQDPLPAPAGAAPDARPTVALFPGGAFGPTQRWPLEKWAAAAKAALAAQPDIHFVICGTADEAAQNATLAAQLGNACTDLTGRTADLTQLAAVLRRCRTVVCHDSGPLQFAALLGLPTVGIFGPTESAHTAPPGPLHLTIRRHVECSPCYLRQCPMDHRCMNEIPPETVTAAILRHCAAR